MRRPAALSLAPVLVPVLALALAGCSGPVEPDRGTPTAAPSALADASAPFLATDCARLAPPVATGEPVGVPGIDGVFVELDGEGVPTITISDQAPDATTLQTLDLVPGKGPAVEPGSQLTVNYCGVGLRSRKMFDSSWAKGEPASFALDGLIQGWVDGLPGMKAGSERLLVIPGELAYGPTPPTAAIGPNETLVFVVQLLEIA